MNNLYFLCNQLAMAISKAGGKDCAALRNAMEQLGHYKGLVREYSCAYSATQMMRHCIYPGYLWGVDPFGNVRKINEK